MPNKKRDGNAIKVRNIAQHLKIKRECSNAIYRITPKGKEQYIYKGETLTPQQFEEKLPMNLLPINRENYDRSKNWMSGRKSY